MRTGSLLLATFLLSLSAAAQPRDPVATREARANFRDGLAHAQRSEFAAAIQQFESAYRIQAHFSVLYNIGQAQAALGKPVEAVSTFERYLAEGAERIAPARREEVQALIASNRARIGQLRVIAAAPELTRVWLDGVELSREQLGRSILLAVGEHTLLSAGQTGAPATQRVLVAGPDVVDVRVARPRDAPRAVAQLAILCDVPGVTVEVVGISRTKTPLAQPLLVPIGELVLRFSRPGYRDVERSIATSTDHVTSVRCEQRPDTPLPPNITARMRIHAVPSDAQVFVDGQRFLGGPLPFGPHAVRIERDGYAPHRTTLVVARGKTLDYSATLKATEARSARAAASAAKRRSLAYVLGGTGGAFLLTGGGLLLWNNRRYDDWRASANQSGPTSLRDLETATSVQRVDDLAFGLMSLGAGFALGGSWLLFSAPPSLD